MDRHCDEGDVRVGRLVVGVVPAVRLLDTAATGGVAQGRVGVHIPVHTVQDQRRGTDHTVVRRTSGTQL